MIILQRTYEAILRVSSWMFYFLVHSKCHICFTCIGFASILLSVGMTVKKKQCATKYKFVNKKIPERISKNQSSDLHFSMFSVLIFWFLFEGGYCMWRII